jgi:hypothetical protein
MSTIRTTRAATGSSQRGNLLIENDIFLNPEEVDHNPIIRGVYRKVATRIRETLSQWKNKPPKQV